MIVQVGWAMTVLLFFRGLFNEIITFVTFMDIAFMGLAGASVFIFRKQRKEALRPVRVWAYPVVPLIFVLISAAFALNTLLEKPSQALPGLGLLAIGVVAFFILKKKSLGIREK